MPPKNSRGSTKFPGGRKVIHRTAQTAFVRVITPRIFALEAGEASRANICSKSMKIPRGNYQPIVPRQKHSIV